eukprot:CAMPEP_0168162862 /NCGR_PEP_ID=MMETSP0139_2-20121125/55_1 /TAXON_ID=44445 /ORGANISM="Pseudo-nitzschia australis, Strain 10249 10 AB" /LENGTH=86 /DNA_ID=CAMNT_0008079691 /DNA_START=244 /DNA_END=504 /DNA_ORIENTATION=+
MMQAYRRQASTTTGTPAFIKAKRANAQNNANFKTNWLSDPATYPIIAVMGGAITLLVGVSSSCLMYNPDVQIDAKKRGSVLREPVV